jgi:uncharacterized protein YjbJ (UPF0337 family)
MWVNFARSIVMINEQILEGRWNEIKGKLRSRWGQLTDEDLPQFQGEVDKLVGAIQRKTGAGRAAIEEYLTELSGAAAQGLGQTAENVRHFSRQAADQLRMGYDEAQRFVRERPRESLVICFSAGLITGVLVSLLLSSK